MYFSLPSLPLPLGRLQVLPRVGDARRADGAAQVHGRLHGARQLAQHALQVKLLPGRWQQSDISFVVLLHWLSCNLTSAAAAAALHCHYSEDLVIKGWERHGVKKAV